MKQALIVFILLWVAGCSTGPVRQQTPAPVKESGDPTPADTSESTDQPGVVVRAYEPAEQVAVMPTHGAAVQALLDQAERQRARGELAAAVGSVERALRIEPRNAHLWNRLAHLRFTQGMNQQAEELASKSNLLSGGDTVLKRDNWQLIGSARRARGDEPGARVAERKARMVY